MIKKSTLSENQFTLTNRIQMRNLLTFIGILVLNFGSYAQKYSMPELIHQPYLLQNELSKTAEKQIEDNPSNIIEFNQISTVNKTKSSKESGERLKGVTQNVVEEKIDSYDWKGVFQVNLGGGTDFINTGYFVNGQYNFTSKMSAGATLMAGSGGVNAWLSESFVYFGGRFNYRIIDFLSLDADVFDITAGVNVGSYSLDGDDGQIMFGVHGNARWYFTEKFGAGIELSLGGPTTMNFTVSARF
jgi:hypothetical protein